MSIDFDPAEFADAPPQLLAALEAAEKLFKKIRRLRNQGFANDADVECVREARGKIWNVLEAANWTGWNERDRE